MIGKNVVDQYLGIQTLLFKSIFQNISYYLRIRILFLDIDYHRSDPGYFSLEIIAVGNICTVILFSLKMIQLFLAIKPLT